MATPRPNRWVPALVLAAGCGLLLPVQRQQITPLTRPFSELPSEILGFRGKDLPISPEEQAVAGMSSYVLRNYSDAANQIAFQVYVGYYESQSQGRSIHSPKNCLPGNGWESLSSGMVELGSPHSRYRVNRYLIANGNQTALVYYWYQGRGRIQASEYAVKWELLRDKAIRGRSEEALVRIVVPIVGGKVAAADSMASQVGARFLHQLQNHLAVFPGRAMADN